MTLLRRLIGPRPRIHHDPAHPLDLGLAIGAFRLCDRQVHVMETVSARCVGCAEDDEDVAREAAPPAPVPVAPPVPEPLAEGGPKLTDVLRAPQESPSSSPDPMEAFLMLGQNRRGGGARETVQIPSSSSNSGRKGRTEVLRAPAQGDGGPRRSAFWGRLILEIDLRAPECRIGADPGVEVPLLVPGLLPNHAMLSLVDGRPVLTLSPNATDILVNGRAAAQSQTLRHGDKLHVGAARLRFELVGAEPDLR